MTCYALYLESGPKRMKTMVHVPELLGCVAVGPTTDEAIAATPAAIATFQRFLRRHGDPIEFDDAIELEIADHITEGDFLGNGSPYISFPVDFMPLPDDDTARFVTRFRWIAEDLAAWAAEPTSDVSDTRPDSGGRAGRAILLHVLGAQGSYLSAALNGAKGFSALHSAAERGEIPIDVALRQVADMTDARVAETTFEQRQAVRELSSRTYTLRKAFRRSLEHAWEHAAELSRRSGGPVL